MTWVLLGLGLVLAIEGLALALAPSRIRQALEFLAALPTDRARLMGLAALAAGTALVWLARHLPA
ncbi:MAG: hypothetical protein Q27BPR15_05470 [Rhodobacter sp. CACIA14H1]|nr:MAG: hypothetical protein Q27BPR15_05470 [Rhodobacter sp. CACIA14H1]